MTWQPKIQDEVVIVGPDQLGSLAYEGGRSEVIYACTSSNKGEPEYKLTRFPGTYPLSSLAPADKASEPERGNLILSRDRGQSIVIGEGDQAVKIIVAGRKTKLRIQAPRHVRVVRGELD